MMNTYNVLKKMVLPDFVFLIPKITKLIKRIITKSQFYMLVSRKKLQPLTRKNLKTLPT